MRPGTLALPKAVSFEIPVIAPSADVACDALGGAAAVANAAVELAASVPVWLRRGDPTAHPLHAAPHRVASFLVRLPPPPAAAATSPPDGGEVAAPAGSTNAEIVAHITTTYVCDTPADFQFLPSGRPLVLTHGLVRKAIDEVVASKHAPPAAPPPPLPGVSGLGGDLDDSGDVEAMLDEIHRLNTTRLARLGVRGEKHVDPVSQPLLTALSTRLALPPFTLSPSERALQYRPDLPASSARKRRVLMTDAADVGGQGGTLAGKRDDAPDVGTHVAGAPVEGDGEREGADGAAEEADEDGGGRGAYFSESSGAHRSGVGGDVRVTCVAGRPP